MKKLVITGALAALVAIPVVAQEMARPERGADMTRAAVEARVRANFDRLDANKDGFVTKEERQAARAERREQRRDAMFARLDANKDGMISRAEFDAPRAKGPGGERAEGMRGKHRGMGMAHRGGGKMMERVDADKDGRISLAEMTAARLAHFDRMDADRNGIVTREERKAFRESIRAQRKG